MNHGIRSVKDALQIGSYFAVLTKQACPECNAGLRQEGKCGNMREHAGKCGNR